MTTVITTNNLISVGLTLTTMLIKIAHIFFIAQRFLNV